MIAVTTFPDWAWDVYAKQAITSFLKYWPIPIRVYCESPPPLSNRRMEVRPLSELDNRTEFLEQDLPEAPHQHYMWDVRRFCHKVFAQLDALKDHDQVIWLDADVITNSRVTADLVDFLVDDSLTFLGRQGSYTETGFIGFNKDHDVLRFLDRYEKMYTEGRIYDLPFWTDCHAFDAAREDLGHNLTPDGRGVDDVFSISILKDYMTHHKGPRKMKLNGGRNEVRVDIRLAGEEPA